MVLPTPSPGPFVAVRGREVASRRSGRGAARTWPRRRRARARRAGGGRSGGRPGRGCAPGRARAGRARSRPSRAGCSRRAGRSRAPEARPAACRLAVRGRPRRARVDPGGTVAARVHLDPDRLRSVGLDPQRKAALAGAARSRARAPRASSPVVSRGAAGARLPRPLGLRLLGDVQVVDREELDRPARVERRIGRGRRVDDALPAALELRQRRRQRADALAVGHHDHLEGHDLVAGGEEPHRLAVPDRVLRPRAGCEVASGRSSRRRSTAQTDRTPGSARPGRQGTTRSRATTATPRTAPRGGPPRTSARPAASTRVMAA